MTTPDIVIYPDRIEFEGLSIPRPATMCYSEWYDFWSRAIKGYTLYDQYGNRKVYK